MLRKRYYILFVARDEDGQLRKIPLPLKYVYGFVAAAIVGAFTIVGLAGSYTRMVLKTESYNQVRADRETLRQNYQRMAAIAHNRSVQVASLGALANEVSALYGLRQSKLQAAAEAKMPAAGSKAASASTSGSGSLAQTDETNQQVTNSIDMFYELRAEAMSGQVSRAIESGLTSNFAGDWTELADAPSMWPVEGRVASSFGEREDPINGEGAFHSGVDIDAPYGTPVRAAGDGDVTGAQMGVGYGREVTLDHGHDVMTLYGTALALRGAGARCAGESVQVFARDLRAGGEPGRRIVTRTISDSKFRGRNKRLPETGAVLFFWNAAIILRTCAWYR
jgi:murein DD-endopeptidase MepM/ murein hydrolase activator NlpD